MVEFVFQEFDNDAFSRSRAEPRPFLLLLTVPWCAHCRELRATTFADPRVQEQLERDFIAVHADAERRPDVNARYGLGGWPTIAWLSPNGVLLAQDRFLTAEEMLSRMQQVSHAAPAATAVPTDSSEGSSHSGRLSPTIVRDIADAIAEAFDHQHGGFGEATKFPHSEAIDFALVLAAKELDPRMREIATVTLDRMAQGAIHDAIDGGFFRFSKTRDWRSPNFEKVLDANAQRLRCYLEGYQLFGSDLYRRTAAGIVDWMLRFMRDSQHEVFRGSMDADSDYYVQDAAGRARRGPPRVDETIYTNANAMAISSLLKASVVLNRPELRDHALRAMHFLLEHVYDGAGTVYHYWDGTYHLPGMLTDQAYMIRALIDLSQHSGNADMLLPAEAIADRAISEQRAPDGGFFDILQDPRSQGSMRRRNKSILENAVMAEALVRLSYLSRRPELAEEAARALAAFASVYKEYGYYVAGYGRAVDLVFYPPLAITIVGDRDSEEADALRRAALLPYVPSRMVQMLDPRHDPILMGRSGYEATDAPRAYISVGKTTIAAVNTATDLLAKMEEVEQSRRHP